jgi:O-antigen ligase
MAMLHDVRARAGADGSWLHLRAWLPVAGFLAAGAAVPLVGLELLLLLLGAGAAALLIVYRPVWALLALSAMWIFQLRLGKFGPLGAADIIVGLLLIPLAVQAVRTRRIEALEVPHVLIFLGIGLVLLAATLWAELVHPPPPLPEVFDQTGRELRAFQTGVVFLALFVSFVRTPRDVQLVAAFLAVVILVLVYQAFNPLEGGPGEARLTAAGGFAGNANRLALLCVWGIALFWCLRSRLSSRWWRAVTLGPLLALPVAAVMTGSRNGMVQLALLAVLLLVEQRHWSPAQRARSLVLIVVISAVVMLVVPSGLMLRVTNFGPEGPGAQSLERREDGVRAGIEMAMENPVLGVGPGNYRWRYGMNMGTHNAFLWALTSGGPLLLGLYLLLFGTAYRGLRAAERQGPLEIRWVAQAARFILVNTIAFSLFADLWLQHPFFLLMALTAAIGRLARPPARVPVVAAPAPAAALAASGPR